MAMRLISIAMGVVFSFAAACSSQPTTPSDGPDASVADARFEGRIDAAPREQGPGADVVVRDLQGASLEAFDLPQSDATLSSAELSYLIATPAGGSALRRVPADGSRGPLAVAGFSGGLSFEALSVTGLEPLLPVPGRDHRPWSRGPHSGLSLEQGRGTLLSYHNALSGRSGLAQVGRDGEVRKLVEVDGLKQGLIAPWVAIDGKVERGAALVAERRILVFRLDGLAATPGNAPLELALPPEVERLDAASLSFVGEWIVVRADLAQGTPTLLRGPSDGSAALEPLPLGDPGASPFVAADPLACADAPVVLLRAGASAEAAMLYWIDLATGDTVALSEAAAIAGRGASFGGEEGRLAFGAACRKVAYVQELGGRHSLILAELDRAGGVQRTELTAADGVRFVSEGPLRIANLRFTASAGALVFMAGINTNQFDLYRYDLSSGQLTNVSGIGATAPPFDGRGGLRARGVLSTSEEPRLLFFAYGVVRGETDLWSYALPSGPLLRLTNAATASIDSGSLALCAAQERLYFVARPRADRYQQELYVAELRAGTARQLTRLAGAGYFYLSGLRLSADCEQLYLQGGPGGYQQRLWRYEHPSGTVRPLNRVPRFIGAAELIGDDSTLVYGAGGEPSATTLKGLRAIGGEERVLDPNAGEISVLGASLR